MTPEVIFLQLSVVEMNQYNSVAQIKKQCDFMWNYKEAKCREVSFGTQDEHRVQFLGQFRKIYKIQKSQSRYNEITLSPIYYVDMITEQVRAIDSSRLDE